AFATCPSSARTHMRPASRQSASSSAHASHQDSGFGARDTRNRLEYVVVTIPPSASMPSDRPARSYLAEKITDSVRSDVVQDHRPSNRPVPTAHPNTASGASQVLINATSTRSPKLNREPSRTHELRGPAALAAGSGSAAAIGAAGSAGVRNSTRSTIDRGSATGG